LDPDPRASSCGIDTKTCTPIRFHVAKGRVSIAGNSAYGAMTTFPARSCPRGSPCSSPRVTIKDASDRFLLPNTHERAPVLVCSRLIIQACAWRVLERLRPSRPRNRTLHGVRYALGDRRSSWGLFVPSRALDCHAQLFCSRAEPTIFPLTPLSPPLLAPCLRFCGARLGKSRQTVSTPSAVTRSKISRSEVPSLGK